MNKLYPEPFLRLTNKKKGQYYYFTYTDQNGKRRNIATHYPKGKKEDARQFIRDYIDNYIKKEPILLQTFRSYAEPFFIAETCPHLRHKQDTGSCCGEKHLSQCRYLLEKHVFKDDTFANLPFLKIKRSDILNFRTHIRKKLSESVVNKVINAIKVIFTEAFYYEHIDRNPGAAIGPLNYTRKKKGILTIEEIKTLFHERPGIWKYDLAYDVFFMAAQTGMRAGEILALDWDHVDIENRVIYIHQAWKTRTLIGLPKWNKEREIFITKALCEQISSLQKVNKLLFCYENGMRLGQTWWQRRFIAAMEAAGIDYKARNITAHSFRHSLNTHLVSSGFCDIILIQAYLGWSANFKFLTAVQEGYTHIKAIKLAGVANAIDILYNKVKLEIVDNKKVAGN